MLCSVYSVFVVPNGTLRFPLLRFSRVFSSVVRQMPGYNSQRRARPAPFQINLSTVGFESQKAFQPKLLIVLFYMYCLCVNVYCTTAPGCQQIEVNKYVYLFIYIYAILLYEDNRTIS